MSLQTSPDNLTLYGTAFPSRLLLGTARYPSPKILEQAVRAATPAMLTVSLRRQAAGHNEIGGQAFWDLLGELDIPFLPNTAGCHTEEEVFTTAMMAREVFGTEWIKLELIGDDYTLQPDTLNMAKAADRLLREDFKVLPYCTEDLVLCRRLVDVGCEAIMPWAAPIGTGKGAMNPYALRLLRERLDVPMLVDAGIGLPSHACQVMEWGFDGVLLNTAVAQAADPVALAEAFPWAIQAGRLAYLGGAMAERESAEASTPVVGTPFWHNALN
jgi:thiazole synthase